MIRKQFDSAMLIAGTALGTGILALPLVSADAGLLLTLAGLMAVWSVVLWSTFGLSELCGA